MSRIETAFQVTLSIELGEPQPTALDKLVAEHMRNMSMNIEQKFTDTLTFGNGFSKQTSFPQKLKYQIIRMDDIA